MGKHVRILKKELMAVLDASLPKLRAGMSLSELAAERGVWPSTVCRAMYRHRPVEYAQAIREGRRVQLRAAAADPDRYRCLLALACQEWPDAFQWPYRKPKHLWGVPSRKRKRALATGDIPLDLRKVSKTGK